MLTELTGGDAADAARRGGPTSLPQQRLDFMQQQAMVVDELLRHFWGLIPVNSAEKEAKLGRIQVGMVWGSFFWGGVASGRSRRCCCQCVPVRRLDPSSRP